MAYSEHYIESNKIHVFPCAYRGHDDDTNLFDPEARLQTEKNLSHAGLIRTGKETDSYIIKYDNTSSAEKLYCVINGYYFEIQAKVENLKTLYITLADKTIKGTNSTKVLASFEQNSPLDCQEVAGTGPYYFTGLYFGEEAPTDYHFKLEVYKNNSLNYEAFLPNIRSGSGVTIDTNGARVTAIQQEPQNFTLDTTEHAAGATGEYAVSLSGKTLASGERSLAHGTCTIASGNYSHAEGNSTEAKHTGAYTSGLHTKSSADYQTVIGEYNADNSNALFIVGNGDSASRSNAVEVTKNKVNITEETNIENKLSNGQRCTAGGNYSHAEGQDSIASGDYSHAEGCYTDTNNQQFAHTGGDNTVASAPCQTVFGAFNDYESNYAKDSLFSIGAGEAGPNGRKNILTVNKSNILFSLANPKVDNVLFPKFPSYKDLITKYLPDARALSLTTKSYFLLLYNWLYETYYSSNSSLLYYRDTSEETDRGRACTFYGQCMSNSTGILNLHIYASRKDEWWYKDTPITYYDSDYEKQTASLKLYTPLFSDALYIPLNSVPVWFGTSHNNEDDPLIYWSGDTLKQFDAWEKGDIRLDNAKVHIGDTTNKLLGTEHGGLVVGSAAGTNWNIELTNVAASGYKAGICYNAFNKNSEYGSWVVGQGFGSDSTVSENFVWSWKPNNGSTDTTKAYLTKDGEFNAVSFNARSDKRLKENIVKYRPKKSILDLPIYKYDFIEGSKNQIGCLAQDLQEICPELVDEGTDGYLSIKESKLVYLLLDEVKKLKQEVEEIRRG